MTPMYQNILLCYDGTAEGRRALRHGADVAIAMKSRRERVDFKECVGMTVPLLRL